jgi:hypothetical protein
MYICAMKRILKLAEKFKESLRNYWVGKMQQSLQLLRSELVRWKVHPKLLEALKGLSKRGDPDGLWGKGTNRALYFYNLAVDWVQKDKRFAEHFASAQKAKQGQVDESGYVSDPELAKSNTAVIDHFRLLLSKIDPTD